MPALFIISKQLLLSSMPPAPSPGIGDLGSRLGRQVAGGAKFEKKQYFFMNTNFMIIQKYNY